MMGEVMFMIILKADSSHDKIYRKMLENAKEPVDWTGIFVINNNSIILLGNTCSFIMNIDKRKVYSKSRSLNVDKDNVIETADNKVIINLINMLLYAFGKWGAVNGLRVNQDYNALSSLFSNILKEIYIQPYYNMSGLKFLRKGIQVTFEEVVITALEKDVENEEEETIGLWHDLKWKVISAKFNKKELLKGENRIGNNFYMVPYICPECQKNLHMLVFPEGKEYLVDTDDGRIYLARVYACPSCNSFYTPRPDRLLKEGDAYYLEFEDDEKAAKDYRVLLGERGDKTTNCNFNMYEADYAARMQKRIKHLPEICRHLELLSDEEIREIISKIEDGFFSERDRERFLAILEQELMYRQKMMDKKMGEFGKGSDKKEEDVYLINEYNGGVSESSVLRRVQNTETENGENDILYTEKDSDTVKVYYEKNEVIDDNKSDKSVYKKVDKNKVNKEYKENRSKKDIRQGTDYKNPEIINTTINNSENIEYRETEEKTEYKIKSERLTNADCERREEDKLKKNKGEKTEKEQKTDNKLKIENGSKENNSKKEMSKPLLEKEGESESKIYNKKENEYKAESEAESENELNDRLVQEKKRKELENLVTRTPDNISRERYYYIKEKLHQYKDIDIKPYEDYIDRKRDKVEKIMIDGVMTGLNGADKNALKKALENLKEMEIEERNLRPVTDDIMKRLRRLDEEAVLDICPNVTNISFEDGIKALEEIRSGDFLPDIKSDMIERIEKRLRKIKSDECEQLVHKLKRECDGKILDYSRIHFYDIRKMNSGDNKDKESSLVRVAVSTYAVLLGEYEYPIVICDSSMFESGKEGFIITPDHIFYKGLLKSGVIDVNSIDGVEFKNKKGIYLKHNSSGSVKLPCALNTAEEKGMAEVLNSFIEYLKAKPQSRSVEYLSKGSHVVKCCYRCGHIFSDGNICPKCGSRNN